MIISRITTQKKNPHRYNIFIDKNGKETYLFSVDEDILIKHHIRKGLTLDEQTIDQFKRDDAVQYGYIRAIQYLSYRTRSIQEIEEHLQKVEVDPAYIPEITERLQKEKYVDDRVFADTFVRHRIQTSTKGPQMVFQELMAKGVSASIAEDATKAYSFDIQEERAKKVAEKRMRRKGKESFEKKRQQTEAALYRNGFSSDVIKHVMDELTGELDTEDEWNSIQYQGSKLYRRHTQKWEGFELNQKVKEGLYRQGFSFDLIAKFIEQYNEE